MFSPTRRSSRIKGISLIRDCFDAVRASPLAMTMGQKKSPEPVGFGTGFLHPSQAVAGS